MVWLLLLPAAASASEPLAWRDASNIQPLVRSSGSQPRLLYFTATWCAPCKLLEREVFEHHEGRAALAHFQLIHVDLESEAGQALSDRFRVATVPTFVVVDAAGDEIDRVRGYRSRRLLLRDLQRIRSGSGAMNDLSRRLAAAPGDPALQAALGLRHYERLELAAADSLLTAGLAPAGALDDTVAAEAGRALADLHRRRGDTDLAAGALDGLLTRYPHHLYPRATWRQLAACHAELGDSVGEVRALGGAARVVPLRVDALLAFAAAAARASCCLEEAEDAARQAVALTERGDPEAQAVLARVLRRRGNYPEAMLWIKRAVALAPDEVLWQEQWAVIKRAAIRGD